MFEAKNFNIFNKANKKLFSHPLTFTIHSNEIWRIKGPNGVGKSSLYESIIGLRPIHCGEVMFNYVVINELKPHIRTTMGIKYIPQTCSLFKNLTIKENLELMANYLVPFDEREDAVEKAIKLFDLSTFIHKLPTQLSGGQKRLSELSKMIIGPNKLVLLDEPFAAIDTIVVENIVEILKQLKEIGMSFLINDHNVCPTDEVADYDIIISNNNTVIQNEKTFQI